uniref:Transforming growth factor beta activator LRRC32 n=1 Tax=Petromyzon marinus TaxID=7757 RepID=A0AAJ7U1A7_PETMA|nr:transforming growth factor beta activator LRRC32 [Petromyzon marinus]XP_032827873.1 transforming growth factor beta activator LRRC32 [Petromyzon marinus]XP_032827874.1 transforming growth factor beta activator LRRC32 [Petromyzon marinus]
MRREGGGTMWLVSIFLYLLVTLQGHGATFRPREDNFVTVPALDSSGCLITARHASCRHRGLSAVPSSLPGDTLQLDVSDNAIASLSAGPLGRYASLVVLTARRNGLDAVADDSFSGLRDLERLDLSENRLGSRADGGGTARSLARALSRLPGLLHLDLSRNGLRDAALGGLLAELNGSSLASLSLAGNSLRSLAPRAFASLPSLAHLDLEFNAIHSVAPGAFGSRLSRLESLSLAYNSLACVSAFGLPGLRRLNLSSNAIEHFDSDDSLGPYRLESLDLSHNRLLTFPRLPRDNVLLHLDASHNRIAFHSPAEALEFRLEVDGGGGGPPRDILAGRFLNVSDDDLSGSTFAPVSLASLRTLDLSHNAVERLPHRLLASAPALTALGLSNNCLRDLDEVFNCTLRHLETLDLSHNSLKSLGGQRSDANAARRASPWPLWASMGPSLRRLSLRDNALTRLPPSFFKELRAVEELDLSQNAVTAVCGAGPAGNRSGGGGRSRSGGSRSGRRKRHTGGGGGRFGHGRRSEECVRFTGAASLRHLDLSECRLRSLGAGAFQGTALTHLNLSSNLDMGAPDASGAPSGAGTPGTLLRGLEHTLEALDLGGSALWRWWRAVDFPSLRKLRQLDAPANNLSAVPPGVFATACQRLDVRDNALALLPADGLAALSATLLALHVSGNPFDCCAVDGWLGALDASRVDVADRGDATCVARPPPSDSRIGGGGAAAAAAVVPLRNATAEGCPPWSVVEVEDAGRSPVATLVIVSTIVVTVLGFGALLLVKPNLVPFL